MKKVKLDIAKREIGWGSARIALPEPPKLRKIRNEGYENLPLYDEKASGWLSGRRLLALQACECTATYALVPGTVRVKMGGTAMTPGKDYRVNEIWGTVGRLAEGRILPKEQVRISYECHLSRIDSLIVKGETLAVLRGRESAAHPAVPPLPAGAVRLANLYWHGDGSALSEDMLYPVTENAFPDDLFPIAYLPQRTLRKLQNGAPVRILAWGDSVTECIYLPPECRWQHRFLLRLRKKYPQAKIELLTEGWGGRNISSFFDIPADEPHNFDKFVLGPKPDLIITEFVNDCNVPEEVWRVNYPKVLRAFRKIGAEWIILTPHYVRPDWMGLPNSKNCDDDPRPLVKFLRDFAARNRIPLGDASRYWGRLYRQGIPYETLYSNGINHPLEFGLSLYADALMKLF